MPGSPSSLWMVAVVAVVAVPGCLPPLPEPGSSPAAVSGAGSPWVRCYRDFQPGSDAPDDLSRLTSICGPPVGLAAVTPVHVGARQGPGSPSERLTFRARAGRCYRFFSVGTPEVTDLDLAVLDPEGQLAAADISGDRFPIVPPQGPLCVERDGVYTVEVAVQRGRGEFVLQVWGDQGPPRP